MDWRDLLYRRDPDAVEPTPEDELDALADPDAVLARHGLVAGGPPNVRRNAALDVLADAPRLPGVDDL